MVAGRLKDTHGKNVDKQTNKTDDENRSKNNKRTSQHKNSSVTVTLSSDSHTR